MALWHMGRHARRRAEVLTADYFAATGVLRTVRGAADRLALGQALRQQFSEIDDVVRSRRRRIFERCHRGGLAGFELPAHERQDGIAELAALGESVDHHVKQEQDEMFPECRQSAMDLKALGTRLAARKAELMAEMSEGMAVS